MIRIRRNLRTAMTMTSAVACVALAFLWPGWRNELRAQGYTLSSPSITIDICEIDLNGVVKVGGKVAEDARIRDFVLVSRGNQNQIVTAVLPGGTFEANTTPGFAQAGQTVTVEIRHTDGSGGWLSTCKPVQTR